MYGVIFNPNAKVSRLNFRSLCITDVYIKPCDKYSNGKTANPPFKPVKKPSSLNGSTKTKMPTTTNAPEKGEPIQNTVQASKPAPGGTKAKTKTSIMQSLASMPPKIKKEAKEEIQNDSKLPQCRIRTVNLT
jgi:hypothetical protein